LVSVFGLTSALPCEAQESSAFELLDRVEAAYATLESYRDQGELVRERRDGEEIVEQRFRFGTAATADGAFLFRLEQGEGDGGAERVIWQSDEGAWQYDSGLGDIRPMKSIDAALVLSLGVGEIDALFVPLLVAGAGGILGSPQAASLEGEDFCEGKSCQLLVLNRRGGQIESRLWVDPETNLVRKVQVRFRDSSASSRRRDGESAVTKTLTLIHQVESMNEHLEPDLLAFVPPPGVERRADDGGALPAGEGLDPLDLQFTEEIAVELRTLAVRALDNQGRPIRGLRPEDFLVKLDKEEIPVEAVDWVSSRRKEGAQAEPVRLSPPVPGGPRDESDGSLIVLFVQADFNAVRVKGHLRLLPFVEQFLAALQPEDWVAVVSFDSHLKLWQDFSRDREETAAVVDRAVRFGAAPLLRADRSISLARSFNYRNAKKAATPERALKVTADSLLDIPGEKILVYLGWGLGRYGWAGFGMIPEYRRTLATLNAAKATVFVLDITDADYHTLELGIRQVAVDTGGTYAKTNRFAEREVMRLVETISGYYLLTLDRSRLPLDLRELEIELLGMKGTVHVRERLIRR
jgi:VWFA-related protein